MSHAQAAVYLVALLFPPWAVEGREEARGRKCSSLCAVVKHREQSKRMERFAEVSHAGRGCQLRALFQWSTLGLQRDGPPRARDNPFSTIR